MRLSIDHTTHYSFSDPVAHGLQRLRMTPKATSGQKILRWNMEFEGAVRQVEYEDQNTNRVTLIALAPGACDVTIRCEGVVDTSDEVGVLGRHSGFLPLWHFLDPTELTAPGPKLRALASGLVADGDAIGLLHRISSLVRERVEYEGGHTDPNSSVEAVLAAARGVCQDHAHVFIGAARMLGIPARYVSGYLMMDDRIEQDAGHAWAEAHVEGIGWVGFDVSNGISPDARYVRIATGRDYRDAAPVTGIRYGALGETMHVSLAVEQQRVEQ